MAEVKMNVIISDFDEDGKPIKLNVELIRKENNSCEANIYDSKKRHFHIDELDWGDYDYYCGLANSGKLPIYYERAELPFNFYHLKLATTDKKSIDYEKDKCEVCLYLNDTDQILYQSPLSLISVYDLDELKRKKRELEIKIEEYTKYFPTMESEIELIIQKYINLKENDASNIVKFKTECNNLLLELYSSYEFEENVLFVKNEFFPKHINTKDLVILSDLDFSLVHKEDKFSETIRINKIKNSYPKFYKYMNDNFFAKITQIESYISHNNLNYQINEIRQQIKNNSTEFYKYYYQNKLINSEKQKYLSYGKMVNEDITKFIQKYFYIYQDLLIIDKKQLLEKIYLFEDYQVVTNGEQLFVMLNDKYKITFSYHNRYECSYRPTYDYNIFDIEKNKIIYQQFDHGMRMFVDDLYKELIEFVINY